MKTLNLTSLQQLLEQQLLEQESLGLKDKGIG